MSAVRKIDYPTAGHRETWLRQFLLERRDLTPSECHLLHVLLLHDGPRGMFPSLDTLAALMHCSPGTVRRARDGLIAKGVLLATVGGGRQSSTYRVPPLEAWWADRRGAAVTPQRSHDRAPSNATMAPEPKEPEKEPAAPEAPKGKFKVVERVPVKGWRALVARAPVDYQRRWLDAITLDAEQPDGTVLLSTSNPAVAARLRADLRDPQVLGELATAVGIDPDRVKIKAPKIGHDPHAERRVRDGEDFDPRRSAGQRLQQWEQRICERIDNDEPISPSTNVVSLAVFRAQHDGLVDHRQ
jgi:hypothetical protein